MRSVKAALFLLSLLLALPAQAQGHREKAHGKPPSHLSQEDRQRLREDVDSARYGRRDRDDRQRHRMAPEEREKLRRDVQDANREMRRNRR
jgi:hypothetical protein